MIYTRSLGLFLTGLGGGIVGYYGGWLALTGVLLVQVTVANTYLLYHE